jgi:hypothetical protein
VSAVNTTSPNPAYTSAEVTDALSAAPDPQEVAVATSLAEITRLPDSRERARRAAELVHKHAPESERRQLERDAYIYAYIDVGGAYGTGTRVAMAVGAKRNTFVRIKNRRAKAEASGRLPEVAIPKSHSEEGRQATRDLLLRRVELLHKQMVSFDEKIEAARDVRDSALAELFDPANPQYEPSNEKLAELIGVDPQHIYYMRRKDRVVRALRAFHEDTRLPLSETAYETWLDRASDLTPDLPGWGIVQVAFRSAEKAADAAGIPYQASAPAARGRAG